jgi:hypothetical protein
MAETEDPPYVATVWSAERGGTKLDLIVDGSPTSVLVPDSEGVFPEFRLQHPRGIQAVWITPTPPT